MYFPRLNFWNYEYKTTYRCIYPYSICWIGVHFRKKGKDISKLAVIVKTTADIKLNRIFATKK